MTSLRRVVVALVLIGIALAVPVGVLVVRALETAAREEENRHRVLAERVFDEMEDSLSRFLAVEEGRPYGAYRSPPEGSDMAPSPLWRAPDQPFVVGYFQIEPDGSLRTPRVRSPEVAALEVSLRAAWDASTRIPEPAPKAAKRSRLGLLDDARVPESVVASASDGEAFAMAEPQEADRDGERRAKEARKDSYAVYRSLNRAEERRAERKQKVVVERALANRPAPRLEEQAETDLLSSRNARPGRVAPLAQAAAGAPASPPAPRPVPEVVRIALDPMLGRRVGDDRLVLYRTVFVGDQAYRQGLLVDWKRLGAWLDAEVLAPSGLGELSQLDFFGSGRAEADPGAASGAYVYAHRFAEPFDAFGARLALTPLPGGDGTGVIYALVALLTLVAAGGGVAVFRMVSVVVQFAERRSRFAASVSHELKTPLTSIRMYAEMLRDGLVPSERKREEYYHTITDESERLSRLIDNVLDFSRLEKGEYEIQRRRGDVLPVVREAVAKLAPHVERQGFELSLEVGEEPLPEVDLDRDALTQVIFNLVDNATKYARGADEPRIVVECRTSRRDPGSVEIAVRDPGPGVPPKDLAAIFQPFFRREDELTRATKGTGIGLALVKELVESLGGHVAAENVPGGGFRVRVTLSGA